MPRASLRDSIHSFIHPSIRSFNKYRLSTYSVPGTVVDAVEAATEKMDQHCPLLESCPSEETQQTSNTVRGVVTEPGQKQEGGSAGESGKVPCEGDFEERPEGGEGTAPPPPGSSPEVSWSPAGG